MSVRFGILGTATIADKVHRAITLAPDATCAVIASRSAEKAAAWAKEKGVPRSVGGYQAVLDDPEIDAVYVPLPPHLHREWTVKAAEAGKHVLCEKPIAASVDQAREMVDACRQHGVQLMDGTFWVHHDRTAKMREVLDSDVLGEHKRFTSAFSFRWPEIPADDIRTKPEMFGGSLADLGWYPIRALWWAWGEFPQRVFATARYVGGVDMNLSALLWYSGDRMASFDCGFDTALRQWFEVAGTGRHLVVDDFVQALDESKSHFHVYRADEDDPVNDRHTVGPCVQQAQMVQDFCKAILSGNLNEQWPADTLATMRILMAVAKAAREEKVVEFG